jgi:hypothetical protein
MDEINSSFSNNTQKKVQRNPISALSSGEEKTVEIPENIILNGHKLHLVFSGDSKNKAKRVATKQHKLGFYTRVVEITPTVWTVYRRNKIPYLDLNQNKVNDG